MPPARGASAVHRTPGALAAATPRPDENVEASRVQSATVSVGADTNTAAVQRTGNVVTSMKSFASQVRENSNTTSFGQRLAEENKRKRKADIRKAAEARELAKQRALADKKRKQALRLAKVRQRQQEEEQARIQKQQALREKEARVQQRLKEKRAKQAAAANAKGKTKKVLKPKQHVPKALGHASEQASSSDDEPAARKQRQVPRWARKEALARAVQQQFDGSNPVDVEALFQFGAVAATDVNLEAIFDRKKARYKKRGSSGMWIDPVTVRK